MVSYKDTPFSDLLSDEGMAPFPWVHGRFQKPETSKNFRPFSDARDHDMHGSPNRETGAPEPETPHPVPTPRPRGQSPVPSESRQPVERLFVRMSLAPAAVHNPGLSVLLSFGGWDHYSFHRNSSTSLGVAHRHSALKGQRFELRTR